MSLDREEQMLVMQLADGELDEAERQRAMQLVETKPAAAALLAEMGFVGDWARESQREGQKVIEVFDVAAEMEAQVSSRAPFSLQVNGPENPAQPSHLQTSILVDRHEPHVLVDLDAQRRRRASRRTQTMAVVGALAVAAAALFVVRAQDRTAAIEQQQQALAMQMDLAKQQQAAANAAASGGTTVPAPVLSAAPASSLATAAQTGQGSGVTPAPRSDIEVNGVDAKEHDVTVFYPPAGDPNSSVVVWIEEKPH
jgi:hypothetical protein